MNANKVNVYYNSACPVCKAGINSQKGKSLGCEIDWNDVHRNNELVDQIDRSLPTVRKYLHLTDQHGQLKVGMEAFLVLWKNSPREQWLYRFFSLPVVRQLSQAAYFVFANLLYGWNRLMKNW